MPSEWRNRKTIPDSRSSSGRFLSHSRSDCLSAILNSQLTSSLKETYDCVVVQFHSRTGNWLNHSDTINRCIIKDMRQLNRNAHACNFRSVPWTSPLVGILSLDVYCFMHNMIVETKLVVNIHIGHTDPLRSSTSFLIQYSMSKFNLVIFLLLYSGPCMHLTPAPNLKPEMTSQLWQNYFKNP